MNEVATPQPQNPGNPGLQVSVEELIESMKMELGDKDLQIVYLKMEIAKLKQEIKKGG